MKYTPKQHITDIVNEFSGLAVQKYKKGQKEHGGRLWRKPVINEIMPEAIDFVIYVSTLLKQIGAVKQILVDFLYQDIQINDSGEKILQALNILEYGNPDGKKESGN